jgi:hypothetical protein
MRECLGKAMAHSAGLTGETAASHGDHEVILGGAGGDLEGLT